MTNKINGIDVSECKYLNKVVNEEPYCNIDEEHLYTCSSDENCYFKQLKRLQEENKELRQVRKNFPDIQMPYIYLYRQIKKQCHKLQKENEELREEKDGMQIIINNYIEHTTKYRQALEEIKKWATNHNPCDIEAGIDCTKEDCFDCLNYDIKKITKIINEVLNDN